MMPTFGFQESHCHDGIVVFGHLRMYRIKFKVGYLKRQNIFEKENFHFSFAFKSVFQINLVCLYTS